jgi:rsbT co-antagonist protein RsbR
MVVSKLTDTCLYSGFFGRLDSARMKSITDDILEAIEQSNNDTIVIDLSNVDIIDSAVAAHLIRTGDVIKLVGCNVIFCGINSKVAQAMMTVGVEFTKYMLCKDLKSALKLVFQLQGFMLVPIPKAVAHPPASVAPAI